MLLYTTCQVIELLHKMLITRFAPHILTSHMLIGIRVYCAASKLVIANSGVRGRHALSLMPARFEFLILSSIIESFLLTHCILHLHLLPVPS